MKLRTVTLVSLFGIGEGNEDIFFAMSAGYRRGGAAPATTRV
jgi:hypothetical protein